MAALPNVPNCIKLDITGTKATSPWAAIQYLRYAGPAPSTSDLNTVAQLVGNSWNTHFAAFMDTATNVGLITAVDLSSATGAGGSSNVVHVGSRPGTSLAGQVACVVSWHINLRYRGGHPRTYFVFGVAADIVNGHTWVDAPFRSG